jgi:large subunit ribosomal protein L23
MNSIIRPVITEKSMGQATKSTFSFIVNKSASKELIKKHVEKEFSVNVTNVSTVTMKGRVKRVGQRRMEVKVSPLKKAIVTLKDGQKISMFSLSDEK